MAVKTWTATNSRRYRPDATRWESDINMYHGNYSTSSYNNAGFAWFNTSDIASTLSGQIIDKVEVYVHRISANHGYSAAVPITLYNHNVTSGGSVSTSAFTNIQSEKIALTKGQGGWVTVTNAMGEALRNGSSKGIVAYTTNTAASRYAIISGYNTSNPPQVRITYHTANTSPTQPGAFTSPTTDYARYESSVSVSWGKATDPDGDTVTYRLFISYGGASWTALTTTTSTSYTHNITGIARGTHMQYYVQATDGEYITDGPTSAPFYRNQVPNTPGAFTSPSSGVRYESSIPVSWGASTDPDGHSVTYRLEVSINGGTYSQIYSGASRSYTHSVTGITRGQSIRYRARAYDGMAYGNYTYSSTCYRNNAPSTPGTFTSPSGTIKRESKTISWGHSTDDATAQASLQYEVGISTNGGSSYSIIRSFATGNSFSYNFANVSTDKNFTSTNCYLRVRARDGSNITSGYRTSSKFTIDFKQPPTLPGVFTGVGTSAENQTITIGWGASTDPNGDAITYLVQFWNRSSWITIASENTTRSLSYKLPAVSAQYSDYKFRVRAKDATGLTSSYRESGTFTITQSSAPSLVANTYSQRTMATVKVSGSITNLGGHSLTQYGIKWGTSSSSLTNTVNLGTRSTTGSFTGDITGLDGNTVYYARTYATNAKGTTLSSDLITIPKYNPPLYIDTLGVGVGKKREQGALDVAGDLYSSGLIVPKDLTFYNYDSGVLIDLIPATTLSTMLTIIVTGNGYGANTPIMTLIQAYHYTPSGNFLNYAQVNLGDSSIGTAKFFLDGGRVKCWFSQGGSYKTLSIRVLGMGRYINDFKVTNTGEPTGTNKVTCSLKNSASIAWGDVTGKPSTFTPSSHSHAWSAITSKPSTFAPSAHNQAWSTITGTPSTYTPSSHNHSGANITSGTVPYARLPVGTGSSQVAQGSHGHSTLLPKSNIRVGSFTANSSNYTAVSFASAMSAVPKLVAQYATTGANVSGDRGSLKLYNITASGFRAYVGGSLDATARDCHYIAII